MGHVSRDLGAIQMTRGHVGSLDHSSHRVSPESGPRHPINLCTADNLWSVINSLETFFWNKHVYYCLLCPLAGHQHIFRINMFISDPRLRLRPTSDWDPRSLGARAWRSPEHQPSALESGPVPESQSHQDTHSQNSKVLGFVIKQIKPSLHFRTNNNSTHIKSHREIVFCSLVT